MIIGGRRSNPVKIRSPTSDEIASSLSSLAPRNDTVTPMVSALSLLLLSSLPLWFHELIHFSLSTLAALMVWRLSIVIPAKAGIQKIRVNFFKLWVASLASGFFIDIDHIFDHFIAYGISGYLDRGILSFFTGNPFLESGKVYIFFHSWELFFIGVVLLFLILKLKLKLRLTLKLMFVAFLLSYFFHLCFDQLTWPQTPWGYFLIYRFFTNFSLLSF